MKRPETKDDTRDVYSPKTPPKGVALQLAAAPDFIEEDCTGRVDLSEEQKQEIRRKRSPSDQLDSLMKWRTEKDKRDHAMELKLTSIDSKLDTMGQFLGMKTEQDGKTHRAQISTNGKVMIAIVVAAITTVGTVLVAVLK
jgi:hypothetical protein